MKHLITVFFSITLAQNCRDILRWKRWGCNTGAVFKYLSKEYFNHTDLSKLTHWMWNSDSWHLAHSLLHLHMLHMCSTALQHLSQSARHRSNHHLYLVHGVREQEGAMVLLCSWDYASSKNPQSREPSYFPAQPGYVVLPVPIDLTLLFMT